MWTPTASATFQRRSFAQHAASPRSGGFMPGKRRVQTIARPETHDAVPSLSRLTRLGAGGTLVNANDCMNRESAGGDHGERDLEPRTVTADHALGALDPHWRWNRAMPAPGHTNVDFEVRVDFRRLHAYRLGAGQGGAEGLQSRRAAPLRCQQHPLRPGTKIGEWSATSSAVSRSGRRSGAGPLGLRLRRRASPALLRLAAGEPFRAGMLGMRAPCRHRPG